MLFIVIYFVVSNVVVPVARYTGISIFDQTPAGKAKARVKKQPPHRRTMIDAMTNGAAE